MFASKHRKRREEEVVSQRIEYPFTGTVVGNLSVFKNFMTFDDAVVWAKSFSPNYTLTIHDRKNNVLVDVQGTRVV